MVSRERERERETRKSICGGVKVNTFKESSTSFSRNNKPLINSAVTLFSVLLLSSVLAFSITLNSNVAFGDTITETVNGTLTLQLQNSGSETDPSSPSNSEVNDNQGGQNGNNGQAIKASAMSKNSNLVKTGDFALPAALILLAAGGLAGIIVLGRKKLLKYATGEQESVSATSKINFNKRTFVYRIIAVWLGICLVAGGVVAFSGANEANATDQEQSADVVAKITVNEKGEPTSASTEFKNNLPTAITVNSVDFGEIFSDWRLDLSSGNVIGANESLIKYMELDSRKISESLLNDLNNNSGLMSFDISSVIEYGEPYIVTFDLNAPTGQTCTWGNVTSPNTLTSLAWRYIIEPTGVTGYPTCTSNTLYSFSGWYDAATGGNLITVGRSKVSGDKTIYAHWSKDAFLANVYNTNFDPTNESTYVGADITSITDVKVAAERLAKNRSDNPNKEKFNATNDAYHLFVKIRGEGRSENDWLECRIIQVGQHDGDESGLTFQTVHVLPDLYKWDENWRYKQENPNWSECSLRTTLNGKMFNTLPEVLKINIKEITKISNKTEGITPNGGETVTTRDKLWVLSYTEYAKYSTKSDYWDDANHDGSAYQFWSEERLSIDSGDGAPYKMKRLDMIRSEKDISSYKSHRSVWERSLGPDPDVGGVLYIHSGALYSRVGYSSESEIGVALSFAF